jgi:hypothetical protein
MQVFDDRFQAESGWNCIFLHAVLCCINVNRPPCDLSVSRIQLLEANIFLFLWNLWSYMKCRVWVILFLVVLWISLCAPQYNATIISITNPTCRTHTPPVEFPFAANNQTLFLVHLDSVTKQQFEFNISVVHTTFTSTYKDFLNRTGGTWLRFLEKERALSFLSHVQIGVPPPPPPLMVTNCFFPQGKSYNGERLSAFLLLFSRLRM